MTVAPCCIKPFNKGMCSDGLITSSDGYCCAVFIELSDNQSFNRIVHRIEPIHKYPKGRKVLRFDQETTENGEEGR